MRFSPRFRLSRFRTLIGFALVASVLHAMPPGTFSPRFHVDQFGYLPDATKVAVLSDPQTGFNAAESYTPAATLELRRADTQAVVWSGAPQAWNGGATHAQSGDRLWWVDFSGVTRWGEYYLYDPAADLRSGYFRIDERVYVEVLRQATRVFFYQRRGQAKPLPFAEEKWTDGASHLRANQDPAARLVTTPGDAGSARDLRGGWYDAGDLNKYVGFTTGVLSDLLFAYRHNPAIWTDDFGLPESGNGVPDLLDEVRWELDWLRRMQGTGGAVLSKVGVTGFESASPPSADTAPVYYGAASTSATLSAAASFAHSALAFSQAGQADYAATLRTAALAAWDWADANPGVVFSNTGFSSANPETDAYGRAMLKLGAAVFLYELTGEARFKTHVESNYLTAHAMEWWYWYPFETTIQDALLHYSSLPGATPSVASEIRNRKHSSMQGGEYLGAINASTDGYRAYVKDQDLVWGSNQVKAKVGLIFDAHARAGIDAANAAVYRRAAAGYLHYLHGVNPLGVVFLTNMGRFGAELSVNQMYHTWFTDGSDWDHALLSPKGPAPGYVVGGVNVQYAPDPSYSGPPLSPPQGQPPLKSFLDWNSNDWRQASWQIAEPAIYYQAAYLALLARFVRPASFASWAAGHGLAGTDADGAADPDGDGRPNRLEFAVGGDPATADRAGETSIATVEGESAALEVRFERGLGLSAPTLRVQGSADLITWTELGMIEPDGRVQASGGAATFTPEWHQDEAPFRRTLRVRVPAGATSQFLRLQADAP